MNTNEIQKPENEMQKVEKIINPIKKIKYGNKEYEIKLLTPKQLMGIVKIISNAFGSIPKKNLTRMGDTALVLAIIERLEDNAIHDLVKILLDCTLQEAVEGYKLVDFMNLITVVMKNEDIQQIFFQITQMLEAIQDRKN